MTSESFSPKTEMFRLDRPRFGGLVTGSVSSPVAGLGESRGLVAGGSCGACVAAATRLHRRCRQRHSTRRIRRSVRRLAPTRYCSPVPFVCLFVFASRFSGKGTPVSLFVHPSGRMAANHGDRIQLRQRRWSWRVICDGWLEGALLLHRAMVVR